MVVSIGTTPGGTDLADGLELTANVTNVLSPKTSFDTGGTIYFTGVSGGTLAIKLIKKSI